MFKYLYKAVFGLLILLATNCLQAQTIFTIAGNGTLGAGGDGVPATQVGLIPWALATSANNLYISDIEIAILYLVTPVPSLTAVIENLTRVLELNNPQGLATTEDPNIIYIADSINIDDPDYSDEGRILRFNVSTGASPVPVVTGLNQPADVVELNNILYIADQGAGQILQFDLTTSVLTTLVSGLNQPSGLDIDPAGLNLYIANSGADTILKFDLTTSVLTNLVDSSVVDSPSDVVFQAVSPSGVLYISDTGNNRILKLDLSNSSITTVAGTGTAGFSGDGGPATEAELNQPQRITLDVQGNLYIADTGNFRVRLVAVPSVSAVSPNTGHVSGGTIVEISGSSFSEATQVFFGTTPALDFTVNSDNSITAISPPGFGFASVRVATDFGISPDTAGSQFLYLLIPLPTISNISPDSGLTIGGTVVTITGNEFIDVAQVLFGTTPALSFKVNSKNSITAIAPPGTGTVDVRIVTLSGEISPVTPNDQFTYISLFPPKSLKGKQVKNRFATQTDIVNVLTWSAPLLGEIPVAYKIYRNAALTKLIKTVKARHQNKLRFEDHNRRKNRVYTYFIVSVDTTGTESIAASVTVGP